MDSAITSLNELNDRLLEKYNNKNTLLDVISIFELYSGIDWKKYVKFNKEKYHREIVYNNILFDIIIISWIAGQKSKIHDHPTRGCLMKVLEGELHENVYKFNTEHKLELLKSNILLPGKIAYKECDSVLHDIMATCNTISVHIYSPCGYVPKCYN